MAVVDPYSPCPCGSGQKFKWCCHKVEAVAERAHRLFEGGQTGAAVEALDEGLRKDPGNAWLLTRKALYLTRSGQPEPAKAAVRLVLEKNPGHAGAQMLMTRLVLETEGPSAGAAQLQQALTAFPADHRGDLAGLVKVVGAFLSEAGEAPAALKHLRLARSLHTGEPDAALASTLRAVEGSPTVSPWQKNPYELAPTPGGLTGEARGRFEQALGWAAEGLWASAAASFETLSGDGAAAPAADRNLGLLRLWLADDEAAVAALRRYTAKTGPSEEAVDLEALCQQIGLSAGDDHVEHVQLTWRVRDRKALLDALAADPMADDEGRGPLDPEDPESAEVDQFALLDRPALAQGKPDLKPADIPRVVGRVLVGEDVAALETYDDGRLDRLAERFTATAGRGVVPAHPKTKVLGQTSRLQLAMMYEWLLPQGMDPALTRRLNIEQSVELISQVWPNTTNPALRGRTPLQAAGAADAETPLRAAVFQFEHSREGRGDGIDFPALRAKLRVPAEPEIDPETVNLETLHLARLRLVPAERLSDEKLVTLYRRARQAAVEAAMVRAARALADRPGAMERLGVESLSVFTDLASVAAGADRTEEAAEWVRRGREADPAAKRARNAPAWDIFEVRLKARTEAPEAWVPELAVILDRYREDQEATQTLLMNLIDMGLLEMVSHPDRPGDVMLDSRPLQALMAEYGPRVTTASGRLGVSAAKPEIWTPGGAAPGGSSGGLWTPGSGPAPGPAQPGGGSKLIVPGR